MDLGYGEVSVLSNGVLVPPGVITKVAVAGQGG